MITLILGLKRFKVHHINQMSNSSDNMLVGSNKEYRGNAEV